MSEGEASALAAAAAFRARRQDLQHEQVARLAAALPLPQLHVPSLFSVDLGPSDGPDAAGVEIGTEVVLLGRQGDEVISASEWAAWLDTIPYEVCCGIGERVPRRYCG